MRGATDGPVIFEPPGGNFQPDPHHSGGTDDTSRWERPSNQFLSDQLAEGTPAQMHSS